MKIIRIKKKSNSSPVWEGKTNGVQKEPLGFWAGTSESSARNVKVLQMRYSRIVIRFWFIFPYLALDYVNAPSGDADRAVLYAESQIGKPYDIGSDICATILDPTLIFSNIIKWRDDNFYCSQLVWHSWASVSGCYDFSGLRPLVLPADFELSMNTTLLTSFNNINSK